MRDDLRKRIERLDPGKPEATPSPVYLAEFERRLREVGIDPTLVIDEVGTIYVGGDDHQYCNTFRIIMELTDDLRFKDEVKSIRMFPESTPG